MSKEKSIAYGSGLMVGALGAWGIKLHIDQLEGVTPINVLEGIFLILIVEFLFNLAKNKEGSQTKVEPL